MEEFSKEGKRDNIQSFFSLQSTKREKSDIFLISTEVTVFQSNKVGSSFTTTEQQQRQFLFYIRIDCILIEMNNPFSQTIVKIFRGISSLSLDSSIFLEVDELKICVLFKCNIRLLSNGIHGLKPMLK
jgi:hypothetical protein